ncbi:flavodoxin family protein [Thermodesulfobacteriota bacterium]
MMKVIGFNSSPRKNGNTMTLVEAVLKGSESKGAETRMVNLREINMSGCLNCDACKKDPGNCAQKDDLSPLLKEIIEYDAIVLGTPVYWFHVNAQLKMLIDRFYCYLGADDRSVLPAGKKFIFVTSRADAENTKYNPQLYEYMNEWIEVVANFMRAQSVEFIHHYGSRYKKDSAKNNTVLIGKAESVGKSLARID